MLRAQSGSTSQATLPPIAPRPSPPMQQNVSVQPTQIVAQGSVPEQYSLFGYSFDGQTYGQALSDNDMSSNVLPQFQHQRSSSENDRVSPKTEGISKTRLGSVHQPELQHRSTGESDSGIDMSYTTYSSHSSTSSNGLPTIPFNPQLQEISPTSFDQPPRRSVDQPMEALFPPYIEQMHHEQYNNPEQAYYSSRQWPSHPPNMEHQPVVTLDCQASSNPIATASFPNIPTPVQLQQSKILVPEKPWSHYSPDIFEQVKTHLANSIIGVPSPRRHWLHLLLLATLSHRNFKMTMAMMTPKMNIGT